MKKKRTLRKVTLIIYLVTQLQEEYDQCVPLHSNDFAPRPACHLLFPHVDRDDLQCLAIHLRDTRMHVRLLFLRVEERVTCGHYRTLPLKTLYFHQERSKCICHLSYVSNFQSFTIFIFRLNRMKTDDYFEKYRKSDSKNIVKVYISYSCLNKQPNI